jgi:hypothetical protein
MLLCWHARAVCRNSEHLCAWRCSMEELHLLWTCLKRPRHLLKRPPQRSLTGRKSESKFCALYAWWVYFPQSGALAEGTPSQAWPSMYVFVWFQSPTVVCASSGSSVMLRPLMRQTVFDQTRLFTQARGCVAVGHALGRVSW